MMAAAVSAAASLLAFDDLPAMAIPPRQVVTPVAGFCTVRALPPMPGLAAVQASSDAGSETVPYSVVMQSSGPMVEAHELAAATASEEAISHERTGAFSISNLHISIPRASTTTTQSCQLVSSV